MHTKLRLSCSQIDLWSCCCASMHLCNPRTERVSVCPGSSLAMTYLSPPPSPPPPCYLQKNLLATAAAVRPLCTDQRVILCRAFIIISSKNLGGGGRKTRWPQELKKKRRIKKGTHSGSELDGYSLPCPTHHHLTHFIPLSPRPSLSLLSLFGSLSRACRPSEGRFKGVGGVRER